MLRTESEIVSVGHGIYVPEQVVTCGYVVYTLSDPRTDQVRYVGCTRQWKSRRTQHVTMKSARHGSKLSAWFSDLQSAGLSPVFEINTICVGIFAQDAAEHTERKLIKWYAEARRTGELLCNELGSPSYAWHNRKTRSDSKRKSYDITFNGETMNVSQWAVRLGISRQRLHQRLKKMTVEQALSRRKQTA